MDVGLSHQVTGELTKKWYTDGIRCPFLTTSFFKHVVLKMKICFIYQPWLRKRTLTDIIHIGFLTRLKYHLS